MPAHTVHGPWKRPRKRPAEKMDEQLLDKASKMLMTINTNIFFMKELTKAESQPPVTNRIRIFCDTIR